MAADVALMMVMIASIALFAMRRGGAPERCCAAIIAFETILDFLYGALLGERGFAEPSFSRFAIDLIAFVGFVWVALRANRVWPLWVAAAQLVVLTGSTAVLVKNQGHQQAYWALTQLPIVFQLTALGVGTLVHAQRLRRIGPYNGWSPRTI